MPVAGARSLKHIFRLSGHPIKGEARGKVENAMKATSFAIGVAAGALLGAAASVAAETYMPASVAGICAVIPIKACAPWATLWKAWAR